MSELEAFIDEVRKLFCETESDVVVEPSVNKLLDEWLVGGAWQRQSNWSSWIISLLKVFFPNFLLTPSLMIYCAKFTGSSSLCFSTYLLYLWSWINHKIHNVYITWLQIHLHWASNHEQGQVHLPAPKQHFVAARQNYLWTKIWDFWKVCCVSISNICVFQMAWFITWFRGWIWLTFKWKYA